MSKLFLSCASGEFAEYRDQLVVDLRRPNVEVKAHEEIAGFNSGVTTLEKLDDYIRGCEAVVHLVGDWTGTQVEAAQVEAIRRRYTDIADTLPPVAPLLQPGADWCGSYSQWEAYLGLYHIVHKRVKRCFIYRAAGGMSRSAGLVADNASRARQAEHWQRLEALGRDCNDFSSREDLRVQVLNHLLEIVAQRSEPLHAEPSRLWKLQTKPHSVFEGRDAELAGLDALWADALADKPGRARIVSLVAIGGAGKTTLVSHWKDALLGREGYGGVERYFDWSFYSQGTRREDDPTSAHTAADATVFIAAALKFFGDEHLADSPAPAWDKGARLAVLVAQHRTLLVLDGLEPLQHPPGPQQGELKDDAIRALLSGLQQASRGVCVITSRERVADLEPTESAGTPCWELDHLTDAAGAAVLRNLGVTGPRSDLESASREIKGHALTLSLMGRYLELTFNPPDISRRDCFHFSTADAETQNGHAFRVFAAYERWMEREGRQIELAVLRLLGLFDRPATPDCLAALCERPALPGLTEALVGLRQSKWNAAIQRLRELDLIETVDWSPGKVSGYGEKEARAEIEAGQQGRKTNLGPPQPFSSPRSALPIPHSLDAHPLLREYFGAQLDQRGLATAAHGRLYEWLCASVPYWPEGRDGLLPLYQAVVHGCRAGRLEDACLEVFHNRIKRGSTGAHAFYSARKLGLPSLDLAAAACFFVEPWRKLAAILSLDKKSWLLGEAAFGLRSVNRLAEACDVTRAAINLVVEQEHWTNASISSLNLSELELTLGELLSAETTATQAVAFADQSGDQFQQIMARAVHADVLHQMGRVENSRGMFAEVEAMQKSRQPTYPLLYSVRGYLYCDLLLGAAEREAWSRVQAKLHAAEDHGSATYADLAQVLHRVTKMFEWRVPADPLLDIVLDHITLGRVQLLGLVLGWPEADWSRARSELGMALRLSRGMGQLQYLPLTLLPNAWLDALDEDWKRSRQRLDEAYALAARGGREGSMKLHLIDTLLYRARLFGGRKEEGGRLNDYLWPDRTPRQDLEEAGRLIDECGYHRRDDELADALTALDS